MLEPKCLEAVSAAGPGTYPLTFIVDVSGNIQIIDIDRISAYGELKENSFSVLRHQPRQLFEGAISNGVISGTTSQNRFVGSVGSGTFQRSCNKVC